MSEQLPAYVLALADDALVLSHRIAEWSSWAPQLEEDMALTNIALDLLGQARGLLTYAGELEGRGRTEDDLAYLREEPDFRCVMLVEEPTLHDFGRLMAVLLFFSAAAVPTLEALSDSSDARLAELAAKGLKEARYHLEHAAGWVIRLGDGTPEAHERMQSAIDELWPLAGDLFAADATPQALVSHGIAPDPATIEAAWRRIVTQVLDEATLRTPERPFRPGTGRGGLHSEHLGFLLAEMQYVHRLYPGASW